MSENKEKLEAIFHAAIELISSNERVAYLDRACVGADACLRPEVEALLEASQAAERAFQSRAHPSQETRITDPVLSDSKPGNIIGRYKLLQQIGEGGCGLVFLAEQKEPVHRRVAVKLIKAGMDTKQVIARFEAERQALAMMDHPHIARVFDGGASEAGRPYFVMELVRGVKITEFCDQKRLSTSERLKLFGQVCLAVQHAHQKAIIHRDIKPSNILVTVNDGVAVPKVIDFGIAKATAGLRLTDQTVFTAFEQFIGTPAYMSPEQAEMTSLDIDTRSDIYSLGVLLYELLTGSTPFDAKELMAVGLDAMRRTICEKEPSRPSTRLGTLQVDELSTTAQRRNVEAPKLIGLLRGDLDWIVMKCLEKDRSRRYETANGLAADLQRHLNNEPVVARPPTRAYRLQKAWRRNKVSLMAAGVVASALVAGIALSSWQAIEARKARNAEKRQRLDAQAAQQAEKQQRMRADAEKADSRHLLYVANMNLAQQAWEQSNIGRLRQLLDETEASPDRGFEWSYWQRQSHQALKTLRGHQKAVSSVAFSPDGQRILTGSWDQTAKVWEEASCKLLFTLEGHSAQINSVAFSPDGQRIVTGSSDCTAKVWDSASGKELFVLNGHTEPVNSVAFSPDGQRIVTASGSDPTLGVPSGDSTAKVWDAASGQELVTLTGHTNGVTSAAFSPDGQRLVTGSSDHTAKVWNAANGKELLTIKGNIDRVLSVAFSPDGQRIVTGGWDRSANVWDSASGKALFAFHGHTAAINSIAFSPDGQRIVTGSRDQTAKIWEFATGKELLTIRGHDASIMSVAFSPDGQWIVTGSGDWMTTVEHTARVWDAASGKEQLTLKGHTNVITSVAFSPDGQKVVTGSEDQTVKIWDAASGEELLAFESGSGSVWSVAFSPDGQRIVTASDERTTVWEAASGKELLVLKGHSALVWSAVFSPDGQRIATGSWDETAKVWDSASGKELQTFRGNSGRVWSVAFSPDGRRIISGSDGPAKVWETASGKELLSLAGHGSITMVAAFSPDGRQIATGSSDRTAKVWDAASGQELFTLRGHSEQIWSVAFSPDGRRIITSSLDRTVKLWELLHGEELLTLKGHSAAVKSVAFSPDGRRILTGSWDKTAKIWGVATPQQVAALQEEERATARELTDQRERTAEQGQN